MYSKFQPYKNHVLSPYFSKMFPYLNIATNAILKFGQGSVRSAYLGGSSQDPGTSVVGGSVQQQPEAFQFMVLRRTGELYYDIKCEDKDVSGHFVPFETSINLWLSFTNHHNKFITQAIQK